MNNNTTLRITIILTIISNDLSRLARLAIGPAAQGEEPKASASGVLPAIPAQIQGEARGPKEGGLNIGQHERV